MSKIEITEQDAKYINTRLLEIVEEAEAILRVPLGTPITDEQKLCAESIIRSSNNIGTRIKSTNTPGYSEGTWRMWHSKEARNQLSLIREVRVPRFIIIKGTPIQVDCIDALHPHHPEYKKDPFSQFKSKQFLGWHLPSELKDY